jgi:hypothetical protein
VAQEAQLQISVPIAERDGRDDPQVPRNTDHEHSLRLHVGRRLGRHGRRLIAAVLAISALIPAYGAVPLPALAGSSCTGWKSTVVPPDYIRVGRGDGSVDVVPFRKYVGVVAAREWPYWLPVAARRVGAIAVKQYGWYFTLAGHHRTGFVNSHGKCYDVTDSTRDQLYKPEKTHVTRRTWRSVDYTWSISLRKNGNFFMTGYRYGADVRCGADADGRLLYERSVVDCAHRGKSTYAILNRYISGLAVLDGGATTTSLASQVMPNPLAPPSDRPANKPAKSTASPTTGEPAWAAIRFPAPTVAAELTVPLFAPVQRVTSEPLLVQQATVETTSPYVSSKPGAGGPAIS